MFPGTRTLVVLAGIAAAGWIQGDLADRNEARRRNDFRYAPDPRIAKLMAGAHRSTFADLLWLRTLPDMSKEFDDAKAKARWMDAALQTVTELEPGFGTVYDFGQSYLTNLRRNDPGAVDRAIALLEKGHRNNPESAGILVRLAMIHWLERKDRPKALECLRKAAPLPDMDSISNQMLATLEASDRDDFVALGRWIPHLDKGTEDMKERAWGQFYAIKLEIAKRAVRDYREKHGRAPASPAELREPGLIQSGSATELVLEDLELRTNGTPHYRKGEELMIRSYVAIWGREARKWYAERGRWPTIQELLAHEMKLPAPPSGKRWSLSRDRLELLDGETDPDALPSIFK